MTTDRARNEEVAKMVRACRRIAAATCALGVATGCVQGPNYAQPEVSVPAAYRFGAEGPQISPLTAEQAWWAGFRDPYLDALVAEALATNRDLRIATARVDEF